MLPDQHRTIPDCPVERVRGIQAGHVRPEITRVLLIEPHKVLGRAIKRGLEEEGFAVDVVEGGPDKSLLDLALVHDLVILSFTRPLNVELPRIRCWRNAGVTVPLLVLVLTGSEDGEHACRAGASAWLPKPFPLETLLLRLRQLVVRRHLHLAK